MDSTTPSGKHRALRARLDKAAASLANNVRETRLLGQMAELGSSLRGLEHRLLVHRQAIRDQSEEWDAALARLRAVAARFERIEPEGQ